MPKLAEAARRQRRQALLDAAWRCVARTGYRNLSVDDVCGEAGLSKGSFYTYFDQKQDLLLALLDDDTEGLDEVVETATEATGVAQLQRFLASMVERAAEHPEAIQLRADLWAEVGSDEQLRERFLAAMQARRRRLAETISACVASGELVDVPANALAAIFLALGDGLMLHRAVDASGFRWDNVRRAVNVLLEGLTKEVA